MKRINKSLAGIVLLATSAFSLSACIDETSPHNGTVTEDQAKDVAALTNALPAYFNNIWSTDYAYSYGYGALMHIRDVMTADMAIVQSNYDQFWQYARNVSLGSEYVNMQFPWDYYYGFVQTANIAIKAVDTTATSNTRNLGYAGAAYAFRALAYLDMARMYEFLPNDVYTDGKNAEGNVVTNLTVPIVTEATSEEQSRNNPRATRQQMRDFILSDLDRAERFIPNLGVQTSKSMPNLAAVYGLKARLYMWVEDYPKAQEYARRAINAANLQPMSKREALNRRSGFNTATPWMWAGMQNKDDATVRSKLLNWSSFMANEAQWGYIADGGPTVMAGASFYNRISDTDWRKQEWKAPAGSLLEDSVEFVSDYYKQILPTYASVKFRPGEGDSQDVVTGASTSYPIMRVEEMYFIEAEAAAHQNPAQGKTLLENFMKAYRDPSYTAANANTQDEIVEEIVFQKRVELWGEGQAFFDIKRLNYSVTRGYTGTNFYELTRFNTNGRPAWMNFAIVRNEWMNNAALEGYNNPDPSNRYTPVR